MIRKANKHDREQVIEMMLAFRKESGIAPYSDIDNIDYWHQLLDAIFAGVGMIFIEEGKGLIMGIVTPTIWCDKTFALQELAWYVKPEHRGSTVGYRLFKTFLDYGKDLKEEGRIKFFVMSKLNTSPTLKYERFGFSKMDENWIQ